MSEEMRRKTKKRMASRGRREAAWRGAAFAPKRAVATAKHLAWAARLAQRFGVRSALRGFANATLTDLATHEVIRTKSRIASVALRYDQRQWVRTDIRNFVVHNVFSAKAGVAKGGAGELQAALPGGVERVLAERRVLEERTRVVLQNVLRTTAPLRRTEQVKSVELPLVLAGTRVKRPGGAGNVASGEEHEAIRFEMPLAKIPRRHRRVEVAKERMAKEFGQNRIATSLEAPTLEVQRSMAPMKSRLPRREQEQEPMEMGAGPLRGINVTQVADEVMKQLDRKLIAARERMGKI
jgi:hypothetical protein